MYFAANFFKKWLCCLGDYLWIFLAIRIIETDQIAKCVATDNQME